MYKQWSFKYMSPVDFFVEFSNPAGRNGRNMKGQAFGGPEADVSTSLVMHI